MRGGGTSCSIEGCNPLGSKASRGDGGGSARPWKKIYFHVPKLPNRAKIFMCLVLKRAATKTNPSHLELTLKLVEGAQWRKPLFLFLQQKITAKNIFSFT